MNNPARFTAQPNSTTKFMPADANWEFSQEPIATGVAISQGYAMTADGSGAYTPADNSSTQIKGIFQYYDRTNTDVSSGDEYLLAIPKNKEALVYFTVGAGTFTTADVGKKVKLNDAGTVAVDTSGTQFEITKYISSTRGVGKFLI